MRYEKRKNTHDIKVDIVKKLVKVSISNTRRDDETTTTKEGKI